MLPNLPSDTELKALLAKVKTVAVLGANDSPGRPVDRVGRYLLAAGFTVLPVHPKRRTVWGLPAFPRLADLPCPADLLDLFRAAEHCPAHAREVLDLPWRPAGFWMQLGIVSAPARDLLASSGVQVVEDLCLMVEHRRLFP